MDRVELFVRDHVAHKVQNVYYLDLYRKYLPTLPYTLPQKKNAHGYIQNFTHNFRKQVNPLTSIHVNQARVTGFFASSIFLESSDPNSILLISTNPRFIFQKIENILKTNATAEFQVVLYVPLSYSISDTV